MKRPMKGSILGILRGMVLFFLSMLLVQPVPARPQAARPVGEILKSFKGQHVNADPKDQINPFPTMIIGPRGRAIGRLGGVETILEPGRMVFIPPRVVHEAWNPFDEPAGFIVLMFGEGA